MPLKVTGSIYKILKSQKIISLAKSSMTKQFNIIVFRAVANTNNVSLLSS